ncbi:RNA polymerase II elongation factor ELL2-like isoform X2 [Xenia sp. Carnegie-2017]|uniref:RNA polymerase II elongation factor ELL2-like isoform X2 n=1 Tax=Xenia sp. Carnegie-2017 TaxID=2897299 RepID=UPI001F038CA9|nr:RNA polymerase II elongation factor ELL2-like isoform X2 [Xenia sp. Carnegie-2017]
MAVCLESGSSYNIVSRNGQKTSKSLFLVKLTDSCLKTLKQLQDSTGKLKVTKGGTVKQPSIRFRKSAKAGTLFVPSKNGSDNDGTRFNFTCSNLFMANSTIGLDCLQQKRDDGNLTLLGNICEKITISANNDSYVATKTRMAEVEKERQGSRAKVIELSKNGVKKTKWTVQPNAMQKKYLRNVSKCNKNNQSSKGLREKVIHLLALRSFNKLELRMRLEKDGVKLKDAMSVLTNILQQVSVMQDNTYSLNRHLYSEVQVDTWPGYSDEDREAVRKKLVAEMGSSVDRLSPGPLGLPLPGNGSNKRPLAGNNATGTNPAGKKPRIAHITATSKTEKKRTEPSPPKLTSQPPRNVPEGRASQDQYRPDHETENKNSTKDSTKFHKTANATEDNDGNNNTFSYSKTEASTKEDYLQRYLEIKTYEQRCSYKRDFAREYTEFTETKERLDSVTKQFNELKERLKNFPEGSKDAEELQEEIFKVYEEKKEGWTRDRQRLNYLYPKLSHIKKLVIQYDQAHIEAS